MFEVRFLFTHIHTYSFVYVYMEEECETQETHRVLKSKQIRMSVIYMHYLNITFKKPKNV